MLGDPSNEPPAQRFVRWLNPVRIGFAVALILSLLRVQDILFLHLTDVRMQDFRLLQRGPTQAAQEVVVVAIDNRSLEELGRWPWDRRAIARLVNRIDAQDPRAIGLDIVFSEPTAGASGAQIDDTLARSLRRAGNVALGYFVDFESTTALADPMVNAGYDIVRRGGAANLDSLLRAGRVQRNLPEFKDAAQAFGFFNFVPSVFDGFVRHAPLVIQHNQHFALPLSLATLKVAHPQQQLTLALDRHGVEVIAFGERRIPVSNSGDLLVNYRGRGGTFHTLSALDVLRDPETAALLKDRIVLVGVTATAVVDLRVTPFDEAFPGVEIHATVIDNILRQDFLRQPDLLVLIDLAAVFSLCLALGILLSWLRGMWALVAASTALTLYAFASQSLFLSYGYPLSGVYPLLAVLITYAACALHHFGTESRERRRIRRALDIYLSPSMARLVSERPDELALGGTKRELTVFFSDIRGFTKLAEGIDPETLVDFLNQYLAEMTDIIFRHDGMLDKYIGDGVMAVWGAPLPQEDQAKRACLAALDMSKRMDTLNREWKERGWAPLNIGCAINTGQMAFGNMGSTRHMALTVMGDNVNLAARLEGFNKIYSSTILVTQSTIDAAANAVVYRELDLVYVAGRRSAVRIFEVLGPAGETEIWASVCRTYAEGLAAYRERRWLDGVRAFEACLTVRPDDGPAAHMARRCADAAQNEPGKDWTAVTVMDGDGE